MTKETYADSTTVEYAYDKVNNIVLRKDQNGNTTNYQYNDLYYLTRREYATDPDDIYTYDKEGRMLTAEKDSWLVTLNYDNADRVTEYIQNGKIVACDYDIPGRTEATTYPNGREVVRTTDKRGRLIDINDGETTSIVKITYDLANRDTTCIMRNGVVRTNVYNENNWLMGIDYSKNGLSLQSFIYIRDDEGNVNAKRKLHAENLSNKYQYDSKYRVTNFEVGTLSGDVISNRLQENSYQLDGVGNWESQTTNESTETRTHNEVNELVAIENTNLTYDDNGNMLDDGEKIYFYDVENRLIEVRNKASNTIVSKFQYDALGRRVTKKTYQNGLPEVAKVTYFYYSKDWQVLEERAQVRDNGILSEEKIARQFVDGFGIDSHFEVTAFDSSGSILSSHYYLQNHRWDIVALTDASGLLIESVHYDSYGKAYKNRDLDTFDNWDLLVYGFQGRRVNKETGLMYFRNRYYSVGQGRFITRDPLSYSGGSMGLYEAFASNPINFKDPKGKNYLEFHPAFLEKAEKNMKKAVQDNNKKLFCPRPGTNAIIIANNIQNDWGYHIAKILTLGLVKDFRQPEKHLEKIAMMLREKGYEAEIHYDISRSDYEKIIKPKLKSMKFMYLFGHTYYTNKQGKAFNWRVDIGKEKNYVGVRIGDWRFNKDGLRPEDIPEGAMFNKLLIGACNTHGGMNEAHNRIGAWGVFVNDPEADLVFNNDGSTEYFEQYEDAEKEIEDMDPIRKR